MRCDEVIRELAAPTGDPEPTAIAEHLAGCPACAAWARRAAWLDQLWEATRPAEPAPAAWDAAWAALTQALESAAAAPTAAPTGPRTAQNGHSSQFLVPPAPMRPAPRFGPRRLAAFAGVVLAQAAAILIAVGLAWHAGGPAHNPEIPEIAQKGHPNPTPGPVVIEATAPVMVAVEIEEGHPILIRAEGPVARVVDLARQEVAARVVHRLVLVGRHLGRSLLGAAAGAVLSWPPMADLLRPDPTPGVDAWYVMFNAMESIDIPQVASR